MNEIFKSNPLPTPSLTMPYCIHCYSQIPFSEWVSDYALLCLLLWWLPVALKIRSCVFSSACKALHDLALAFQPHLFLSPALLQPGWSLCSSQSKSKSTTNPGIWSLYCWKTSLFYLWIACSFVYSASSTNATFSERPS
jgi:hypothetical protein